MNVVAKKELIQCVLSQHATYFKQQQHKNLMPYFFVRDQI